MSRATAFILTFLYLTTVAGGTLHRHFCMGKLIGVDVWQHPSVEKKACPQCGMTKRKGCCDDDDRVLKNEKQPDVLLSQVSVPQPECVVVKTNYQSYNAATANTCFQTERHNNSPPRLACVPLYISNCAYLI